MLNCDITEEYYAHKGLMCWIHTSVTWYRFVCVGC